MAACLNVEKDNKLILLNPNYVGKAPLNEGSFRRGYGNYNGTKSNQQQFHTLNVGSSEGMPISDLDNSAMSAGCNNEMEEDSRRVQSHLVDTTVDSAGVGTVEENTSGGRNVRTSQEVEKVRSNAIRTQYNKQRGNKNDSNVDGAHATYNGQRFVRAGKPQSVGNYSSGGGRRGVAGQKLRARAIGTAVENSRHTQGAANSFVYDSAEYASLQDEAGANGIYSNGENVQPESLKDRANSFYQNKMNPPQQQLPGKKQRLKTFEQSSAATQKTSATKKTKAMTSVGTNFFRPPGGGAATNPKAASTRTQKSTSNEPKFAQARPKQARGGVGGRQPVKAYEDSASSQIKVMHGET